MSFVYKQQTTPDAADLAAEAVLHGIGKESITAELMPLVGLQYL